MPAKRHGLRHSRAYETWASMRGRCLNGNNSDFAYYGGRGITICNRWNLFENFLSDMGHPPDGLSLDRIDGDGPYSPDNCRWATRREQSLNRRNRRVITMNGTPFRLREIAQLTGIKLSTLKGRVRYGWSDDEITGISEHPSARVHSLVRPPEQVVA